MKFKNSTQDVCHHSHSFFLDNFIRKLFQNPRKIIGDYINEGDTVVDIGCGPGFFTVEMARMVGEKGRVFAVDLQPEMLAKLRKKIENSSLAKRIVCHNCTKDSLDMDQTESADFVLAYYMIHETPDPEHLLTEVKALLKKGGKFLIVEPKFHVSEAFFQDMAKTARKIGYKILDLPLKKGGRSILLSV